jgi:hypothetical protein
MVQDESGSMWLSCFDREGEVRAYNHRSSGQQREVDPPAKFWRPSLSHSLFSPYTLCCVTQKILGKSADELSFLMQQVRKEAGERVGANIGEERVSFCFVSSFLLTLSSLLFSLSVLLLSE